MNKMKYVGSFHDGVTVPDLGGVHVGQGDVVEVEDDELFARFLEQPSNWEAVDGKRPKPAPAPEPEPESKGDSE